MYNKKKLQIHNAMLPEENEHVPDDQVQKHVPVSQVI
jgi:hypothetical protein